MGTCCSKIKSPQEGGSVSADLRRSIDQWRASRSFCHLCRANRVACHSQFCVCESCRRSGNHCAKRFISASSLREDMCSLCVADVYDAQFRGHAPLAHAQWSKPKGDDENSLHSRSTNEENSTERAQNSSSHASKDAEIQVTCGYGQKQEVLPDHHTVDCDCLLCDGHDGDILQYEHDILQSSLTLSSTGVLAEADTLLSTVAALEIVGGSRRLSNIDDSDGIKLEVRYKHMLPHEAHILSCVSEANVLKRARPQEEPLLADDPHSDRSTRRRKSFQGAMFDEQEVPLQRSLHLMNSAEDYNDDEEFHDILVGISIAGSGCNAERELWSDKKLCHSLDSRSFSDRIQHRPPQGDSFLRVEDLPVASRPLRDAGQEDLQFMGSDEDGMPQFMALENIVGSKLQALSIVSTGDAILLSGTDSDELHLIPSVAMQKAALSSPEHNQCPRRMLSPERFDALTAEKSPLSVDEIIRLLENDELSEYDLVSLLIGFCGKPSPSSSPSSSAESTNSGSSLLSSSTLSSSSPSTSSSSTTLTPPSSSLSLLQLPLPPATYSSALPYSLSLPSSCKMSPHTSFEFKVKTSESIPSTPVFSPIQSRTKGRITHNLVPEEVWGVV